VEQREDAELGVLRLGDEVGLLHGDLGAQAHPFIAALLGTGNRSGVTPQEGQRPADRLGHLVGGW
jgi:hypothetical protein